MKLAPKIITAIVVGTAIIASCSKKQQISKQVVIKNSQGKDSVITVMVDFDCPTCGKG